MKGMGWPEKLSVGLLMTDLSSREHSGKAGEVGEEGGESGSV